MSTDVHMIVVKLTLCSIKSSRFD